MECPVCATQNPDSASLCGNCHTPLPELGSEETLNDAGTLVEEWSEGSASKPSKAFKPSIPTPKAATDELAHGTFLGGRYEILHLIGRGGMGAVYKAHDKELDRTVALKLIRPDLARNPEMVRRFKQELILARQVTHKNVIRIFDLGQSEGIKFITMDFVEGHDLRALLQEKGKFPPPEAARIMLQICRALEAAHSEHVIHRDLKPQNIMLDGKGRVYVMDFGIARSAQVPGMTQTGALVGTPEYMSPEQARGENLDQRSDIFSLGVIFYEILTGKKPYPSDVPLATLWKRMQEPVTPPVKLEPSLPLALNDIVVKALEIKPEDRFTSAREMAHSLEIWLGPSAESSAIFLPAPRTTHYWKWASAALGALLIIAVVAFRLRGPVKPPPAHAPVSVLVADFANTTGDSIFDETLEPPLSVALEDASFISSYNRNQAKKIAVQLRPGASTLEETTARLVGVREGISYIVAGLIEKRSNGYKVRSRTLEAATGKIVLELNENADDKKGVLGAVGKIAAETRRALGDKTPESTQLAAAETFTTNSLEAAHAYALAQDMQSAGKWEEAIPLYEQGIQLDPNLGRAYAGLAATSFNLGRRKDAEKYYQLALAHIDRMSDREKYRTRGGYYLANREPRKAIDEYSALVQQFPSDDVGYSNLALAYFFLRDMSKAVEQGRRAVELAPKALLQLNNLALYAVYAGDYGSAAEVARRVLAQNASSVDAYGALAMAQTGQGQFSEAESTYQKMAGISARGSEMATMGQADLLLYQGRTKDAIALLQKANSASPTSAKMDDSALVAHSIVEAEAMLAAGRASEAAADAKSALAHDNGTISQFAVGRIYVEAGQYGPVQGIISQLSRRLDPDGQAYGKLLEGELSLKRGEAKRAIALFLEAERLSDTWIGRFNLGRAYIEAGAFTEADSELETCLKRRGEASAIYLDDVPTFRRLPPVYYYLGRAQEGLKSPAAAESYKTFLAIKKNCDEVGLVKDAERRVASH
ncbi:MAG TPA: protein kinase [Candidatus Acidoferrum sp.]|nr:protein kinase [Candidatus Acidoferrum sp.]